MKGILIKYNPWWHTKKVPGELAGIKRNRYLNQILPFIDSPEILKITGVRRAGKTTIMFQVIDFLLKKGVDPKNICYIQMDDEEFSFYDKKTLIKEVIEEYSEISSRNIERDKIYFLFDEIQYIENWPGWLKTYYDRFKNIKFVVSGSSSMLIDRASVEKLSGRQIDFMVHTLSFGEFLEFKNIKNTKIKIKIQKNLSDLSISDIEKNIELLAAKNDLKISLNRYLEVGGFPNVIFRNKTERELILKQYFRDIVYRDIVRVFKIRDVESLENLGVYMFKHIGKKFSFTSLSKVMGVSTDTIIEYFNMFLKTFLYHAVTYYSTALKSTIRKSKKLYCSDIGLRNAIISEKDEGEIVENVVLNHLKLNYDKIYYWDNKYECDFIVKTYDGLTPIEVKYQKNPEKINGIIEFMEKFKIKRGIVVTKDTLKKEKFNDREILFIPLWIFLLLF